MATTTIPTWAGTPTLTDKKVETLVNWLASQQGSADLASDSDDAAYYQGAVDTLTDVMNLMYGVSPGPDLIDAQIIGLIDEGLRYPRGLAVSSDAATDGQMFFRLGARKVTVLESDLVLFESDRETARYSRARAHIELAVAFLAGS
jgi:hypothetical protein